MFSLTARAEADLQLRAGLFLLEALRDSLSPLSQLLVVAAIPRAPGLVLASPRPPPRLHGPLLCASTLPLPPTQTPATGFRALPQSSEISPRRPQLHLRRTFPKQSHSQVPGGCIFCLRDTVQPTTGSLGFPDSQRGVSEYEPVTLAQLPVSAHLLSDIQDGGSFSGPWGTPSRRGGHLGELGRDHRVLFSLLPLSNGVFPLENRGVLVAAVPSSWDR